MSDINAANVDYGTGKKTFSVYLIGIIFCTLLTIIPFYLVMHSSLSKAMTIFAIYLFALIQLFVQIFCFLRLNSQTKQGQTNIMAFLFTIVINIVVIGGSLWIMWNLESRMM